MVGLLSVNRRIVQGEVVGVGESVESNRDADDAGARLRVCAPLVVMNDILDRAKGRMKSEWRRTEGCVDCRRSDDAGEGRMQGQCLPLFTR